MFGKKVEIEIPDGKGGVRKVKVSQKQFDSLVAEGQLTKVDGFSVHISDPKRGNYTENWVVGEDLPREQYDQFKDENGDVYVMIVYEAGEPQKNLVKKELWEQLPQLDSEVRIELPPSSN